MKKVVIPVGISEVTKKQVELERERLEEITGLSLSMSSILEMLIKKGLEAKK